MSGRLFWLICPARFFECRAKDFLTENELDYVFAATQAAWAGVKIRCAQTEVGKAMDLRAATNDCPLVGAVKDGNHGFPARKMRRAIRTGIHRFNRNKPQYGFTGFG